MKCPKCGHNDSSVIDSRKANGMAIGLLYYKFDSGSVRRRRECDACHERFSTYEVAAEDLTAAVRQWAALRQVNWGRVIREAVAGAVTEVISVEDAQQEVETP